MSEVLRNNERLDKEDAAMGAEGTTASSAMTRQSPRVPQRLHNPTINCDPSHQLTYSCVTAIALLDT